MGEGGAGYQKIEADITWQGGLMADSWLIKVYVPKRGRNWLVRATAHRNEEFVLLPANRGKALSHKASDAELASALRSVLANCE